MAEVARVANCSGFKPSSQRHNNLPEMLVGFHVLERFADVVELEDLVDRQLQLARLHRAPDVLADFVEDLPDFLDGAGAEGDADIIDPARGVQVEIKIAMSVRRARVGTPLALPRSTMPTAVLPSVRTTSLTTRAPILPERISWAAMATVSFIRTVATRAAFLRRISPTCMATSLG